MKTIARWRNTDNVWIERLNEMGEDGQVERMTNGGVVMSLLGAVGIVALVGLMNYVLNY